MVLQYPRIPQVFLSSFLSMTGNLTGSMQHRGQQKFIGQRQKKRQAPRHMLEHAQFDPVMALWDPSTTADQGTRLPPLLTLVPSPQPINSKAHRKKEPWWCHPQQSGNTTATTISRHTGNTGQQKLSSQLPRGEQSLGLESTKVGGKRLTANT